jgi:pSer/pThr/pTyr-binding forkhead associated (FHA) protein
LQVRLLKENKLAETQDVKHSDAADESTPLKPAFLIISGTKVFPIQAAVTNIGRRADNHLIIDDPRISRYHAQIRYVRGRFIIFDLDSTGGTYVNGQRASQSILYAGDVISLAGLPIIFGQDSPPPSMATGDTAPLAPTSTDRKTAILRTIPPEPKPKN